MGKASRSIKWFFGALLLVAILAPAASAVEYNLNNPPEIGRCVKATTPHTGEYAGKSCINKSATGRGNYNFFSGAGEKKKFEGPALEPVVLETPGPPVRQIVCEGVPNEGAASFSGEYTGSKEATVTVKLRGCSYRKTLQTCQSNPLKAGEIEATGLEAHLGFIRKVHPQVGWDLKAPSGPLSSGNLFTFECGKAPEATAVKISGSVIAQVTPIDRMVTEPTWRYRETAGHQVPEKFEGEPKDTLTATFETGAIQKMVEAEEPIGLRTKILIRDEEALEIKAK